MSETYLQVDTDLIEWLAGGERGISSNAIVKRITGLSTGLRRRGMDYPLDPADFKRCEKLLRAVPALRPELHRMSDVSPVWAALVARWDEIAALLEEEAPGVYDGALSRRAPNTYALMRSIIEEVAR